MTKGELDLLAFAKRALHNLPESQVFIGILDDRPLDAARAAFLMQLGYAVLHDKQIVVPVPIGAHLPAKLEAVADAIVRFNPHDMVTLERGLVQTLTKMGVKRQ